ALPETEGPPGHDGCPAREVAVSADDAIDVVSGNEVVVYAIAGLRIEREGAPVGLAKGALPLHTEVRLFTVGKPFHAHIMAAAGRHFEVDLERAGIPRLPPAVFLQLAIYPYFEVARIGDVQA